VRDLESEADERYLIEEHNEDQLLEMAWVR
jgi:hypothetical protein